MVAELVFDLETQRSFQEVGGRGNLRRLGMSLAVTHELRSGKYQTYREADVPRLLKALFSAGRVIGFNIKRFDFPVLQGYCQADFATVNSLDMLEVIQRRLGFRVSLDKLAQATLNEGKSGHGLLALKWYKEGNWQKLERYCRRDVLLTTRLYLYGKENGFLYYPAAGGKKEKVSVDW